MAKRKVDGLSAEYGMRGGAFHLKLSGRMDTLTSGMVEEAFDEARGGRPVGGVEVDASGLSYISSAGLRVLLLMKKRSEPGAAVRLRGACGEVRSVMEAAGFDGLLELA